AHALLRRREVLDPQREVHAALTDGGIGAPYQIVRTEAVPALLPKAVGHAGAFLREPRQVIRIARGDRCTSAGDRQRTIEPGGGAVAVPDRTHPVQWAGCHGPLHPRPPSLATHGV